MRPRPADTHQGQRPWRRANRPGTRPRATSIARTQSTIRLIGRPVPAWRWAAQGDDMADLQAAVADDDALDGELQDRLLVGERRRLQAPADAGAERFQAGPDRSGLDALSAQAVPFLSLALESAPLLGQAPAPLRQLG